MAFVDNLNAIHLNRGDCFQIPLFINIGTDEEPIRLDFNSSSDLGIEVYFGVHLQGYPFECSFIRKSYNYLNANKYGDVIVSLEPQDTLQIPPGNYLYSVKVRMQDPIQGEWVATVIDKEKFCIF